MIANKPFVRFVVIGIASNAVGYLCYLGFTRAGLGPKLSMTIVYALGVTQSFAFNRSWSFKYGGDAVPAFARYVATYFLGYVMNFVAMYVAVDRFGLPHAWVQLSMCCILAIGLFLMQRLWVFPHTTSSVKSA
jgi:putative flippase GtrA